MQTLAQDSQSVLSGFTRKLKPHGSLRDMAATTATSLQDLDRFLSLQQQLNYKLAALPASHDSDDLSEIRALVEKRKESISQLCSELDDGVQGLRSLLDNCHAVLETRPTTVDPELIVKHSHRLRYAFTLLDRTKDLPQRPPAPQPQFMVASNLNQFNFLQQQAVKEHQEQQRQQAVRELQEQQRVMSLISTHLPPDWQPGDPIPPEVLAIMMQAPPPEDAAAAAAAGNEAAEQEPQPPQQAAAGVAAAPPLLNLGPLNQDLEDMGEDSDWGDEMDEDLTEEVVSDDVTRSGS